MTATKDLEEQEGCEDVSWHFLGRWGEEVKMCRASWKSGSGQETLLRLLDAFLASKEITVILYKS